MRVEQAEILGFLPPGEDTFAELAERFLSFQKARVTQAEHNRERSVIDLHLNPFFNGKVAAIRKADVDRFITKRRGEVAPATVRRETMTLKYALSRADGWEIIPINPAQNVELPKVPPGRVRYLQPTELRALLGESPEWLRPIVELAVTRRMLRSEILKLRWIDLDLEHHCVLLPQTKNGEGCIVYLNESAVAALSSLFFTEGTRTTELLFPGIYPAKVTVAFGRSCERTKIEDFRLHDLRHYSESRTMPSDVWSHSYST